MEKTEVDNKQFHEMYQISREKNSLSVQYKYFDIVNAAVF